MIRFAHFIRPNVRTPVLAPPLLCQTFRCFVSTSTPKTVNEPSSPDSVVIGCFEGETPSLEHLTATAFAVNDKTNNVLFTMLEHSGFKGKLGTARVFYPPTPDDYPTDAKPLPLRVAVVGLGMRSELSNKSNQERQWQQARIAAATGVKLLKDSGAKRIALEIFAECPRAVAEGATLALYSFDHLKTKSTNSSTSSKPTTRFSFPITPLSDPIVSSANSSLDITLLSRSGDPVPATNASPASHTSPLPTSFKTGHILGQAQNLARHLMESPANLLTPILFSDTVVRELKDLPKVSVQVYDEAWILQRRMHAFHAVAKGSKEPLRFVEITYRGRDLVAHTAVSKAAVGDPSVPKANPNEVAMEPRKDVVDIVLIGKGVTFDAGGISLKPSANMADMKGDMGGAATVLAATHAVARLGLPVNLTTLIPLCENLPSGVAVKPGDVVRASNGLTIEIDNTDAEGRLLLADALSYATTLRPNVIVDVATLTGAIDVALGRQYVGVFSTHESLWNIINKAALTAGDPAWRMPLDPSYLSSMQSRVADIKNAGDRSAGACTAAAFLYQFLRPAMPATQALTIEPMDSISGDLPAPCRWAHVDMAGVMQLSQSTDAANPSGMTGRPTRLLIDMIYQIVGENVNVKASGSS